MTSRIKEHHVSEYGTDTSVFGLESAKRHLAEAKAHVAIDHWDETRKSAQVEMLEDVIAKREKGISAFNERVTGQEKAAADDDAARREAEKARVMIELRRDFHGTEGDWQAVKDDLYRKHLLAQPTFQDRLEQARATGRYRA